MVLDLVIRLGRVKNDRLSFLLTLKTSDELTTFFKRIFKTRKERRHSINVPNSFSVKDNYSATFYGV